MSMITLPAMAQATPTSQTPPCETQINLVSLLLPSVISGLPYSATYKLTTDQTLANGVKIHKESTPHTVRDVDGRFLTHILFFCARGRRGQSNPHPIYNNDVVDPVAKEHRQWYSGVVDGDPTPREVNINAMPATYWVENPVEMRRGLEVSEKLPDTAKKKKLGHQTIAGLDAVGVLWTTITPAGSMGRGQIHRACYPRRRWRTDYLGTEVA